MGREQYRGPADPLGDDLRWYFQEAEGELGASSSFGAFIDMAMSGIQSGGRSNGVERRAAAIADRASRPGRRHRIWRERVKDLSARSPRLLDVLWAAYGPTDWKALADRHFGAGAGERMIKGLGAQYLGVALLTKRLARAHADEIGPPRELSDGLNRWELVTAGRGEEPTYRCAGPLVHVDIVPNHERDETLRRRVMRAFGGAPLRIEDAHVYDVAGDELDAVARDVGILRRFRRYDSVAAPIKPAPGLPPAIAPGTLLAALVNVAYPNRGAKTAKQKTAQVAAQKVVKAIAGEAIALLAQAKGAINTHIGHGHAAELRGPRLPSASTRRVAPVYPDAPELASEALAG